jgi:hypothetical protein
VKTQRRRKRKRKDSRGKLNFKLGVVADGLSRVYHSMSITIFAIEEGAQEHLDSSFHPV